MILRKSLQQNQSLKENELTIQTCKVNPIQAMMNQEKGLFNPTLYETTFHSNIFQSVSKSDQNGLIRCFPWHAQSKYKQQFDQIDRKGLYQINQSKKHNFIEQYDQSYSASSISLPESRQLHSPIESILERNPNNYVELDSIQLKRHTSEQLKQAEEIILAKLQQKNRRKSDDLFSCDLKQIDLESAVEQSIALKITPEMNEDNQKAMNENLSKEGNIIRREDYSPKETKNDTSFQTEILQDYDDDEEIQSRIKTAEGKEIELVFKKIIKDP